MNFNYQLFLERRAIYLSRLYVIILQSFTLTGSTEIESKYSSSKISYFISTIRSAVVLYVLRSTLTMDQSV